MAARCQFAHATGSPALCVKVGGRATCRLTLSGGGWGFEHPKAPDHDQITQSAGGPSESGFWAHHSQPAASSHKVRETQAILRKIKVSTY